ncbi:uncharacterized protein LOC110007206 [Amborella trichopoda]|uniref:uncharacterized protein LOC110007206 n=1 Tax=Amborella trichopoda TaxID=13333 RepID=UPI0009C09C76|nr:uncharacterized protein LOC110007206 [Amborella trichopoda]|eukprot:XP_020522563.1 uncharacterized protein LOC110007206 [Amborella trichopoda]
MTDLGLMRYFLGIQVKQSNREIIVSQERFIEDLLKKFGITKCKPVATPMAPNEKLSPNDGAQEANASSYGSLVVSRFMSKPSKLYFVVAKRILRYVQGTKSFSLKYSTEKDSSLVGYTYSDWAGSLDDRKSTSGYIFCLGSKVISWSSRKQKTVALSSAKAEYV